MLKKPGITGTILSIIIILSLITGCKPEGGGGIAGTATSVASGGQHPGYETLIINMDSITAEAITESSAIIKWETNFPATATAEYGMVKAYTNTSTMNESMKLVHSRDLTNLKSSQSYHFRCVSTDQYKNLAVSSDFTFTTLNQNLAPFAVYLNDATDITHNTVKLSWNVSNDNDFKEYRIHYDLKEDVTPNSPLATAITEKLQNEYTVEGLMSESTYYFKVFVRDTENAETGSNTVTAITGINYVPPEPVQFVAPAGKGIRTLNIQWQEYTGLYFSQYRIYKSLTPGFRVGMTPEVTISNPASITWEDSGLEPGTTYYYKIFVVNQGGYMASSSEGAFTTYSIGESMGTYPGIFSPADVKLVKNELFISSYAQIQVFSLDEKRVITSIESAGENSKMAVMDDDETLYVVSPTYNEVRQIDTSSRVIKLKQNVGSRIKSVTLSKDERQLYITSNLENSLQVVRREDLKPEVNLTSGREPTDAITGINDDIIIVANSGTTSVAIFESTTLKKSAEIQIGANPWHLLADLGGTIVYVLDYTAGKLIRVDIRNEAVVDTIDVGNNPSHMVLMNDGRGLLVCCSGDNLIKKYELPSMTLKYSFSTGKNPVSMEVSRDEKELYVVNYGEDNMTIHTIE